MSLDKNLYHLMSTANVAAGLDTNTMDFVLNLEVLNGCAHHCPGCFVNRRNNLIDVDLDTAVTVAAGMIEKGLRFREVILSPTDLFSADNAVELLNDERFQTLMSLHPKTRITTTAMFSPMNWDKFNEIFDILNDESKYRSKMIMEFLVPIDINKIINYDQQYFSDIDRAMEYFDERTEKEIDWSFVVNIHYDQELIDNYTEISKLVKNRFNTIIEFLPSFFRTNNDTLIDQSIADWKRVMETAITEDNYKDINVTFADKDHNSSNTIVINYRRGEMFISPFLYEQILTTDEMFKVKDHTSESIIAKTGDLVSEQFKYVAQTTECGTCEYLQSCIGRNVLSFMESKQITDCVYPKDTLKLFESGMAVPRRVSKCANNN